MRRLLVLLLILGGPAMAESIADSLGVREGTSGGNPYGLSKFDAQALGLLSLDINMPVAQIKGRFTRFNRNKFCKSLIRRHEESVYFALDVGPEGRLGADLPPEERVTVGVAILNSNIPLRLGDIETLGQLYRKSNERLPRSETTYDGSALRITRYLEIDGQPTIGLFEIDVDPNLQQIGRLRYREFIGEELSTAKPTENEMICEDLMG